MSGATSRQQQRQMPLRNQSSSNANRTSGSSSSTSIGHAMVIFVCGFIVGSNYRTMKSCMNVIIPSHLDDEYSANTMKYVIPEHVTFGNADFTDEEDDENNYIDYNTIFDNEMNKMEEQQKHQQLTFSVSEEESDEDEHDEGVSTSNFFDDTDIIRRNLQQHQETSIDPTDYIPNTMKGLVTGMGRISRTSFSSKYDMGLGIDSDSDTNQDVLILYGSEAALPTNFMSAGTTTESNVIPFLKSADIAMENCNEMKIILTSPNAPGSTNEQKQCIAIMGQWDSYHIQKWERKNVTKRIKATATHKKYIQTENKLVPSHSHHNSKPPSRNLTKACNEALRVYLDVYEDAQRALRPIAEAAATSISNTHHKSANGRGPIVVMVSNYGQSSYFRNFVCAAKSRNIDISNVLLFATDMETYNMAKSLNVHVFYDERIFGAIPSDAATDYHDFNYGKIMMSKVYCVHLINSMGYDLVFQDLDVVWYRDPLLYLTRRAPTEDFDMYFQYDGTHHPERFQPLAANTGFYYVKYNERTEYFFSVFIKMGDMVLSDRSHQAAFTTLANEHINIRGLRVKVLARVSNLFLSGFHYHAHRYLLENAAAGKHRPYLFHANWLPGKKKQPVLEETSNWFVKPECSSSSSTAGKTNFDCCLAHPMKASTSKKL